MRTGEIEPVRHVATIRLSELVEIDAQKERLVRNTEQFVAGRAANNALLTGARYPAARRTEMVEDVLEDDTVDAVVIATPVTSHYPLTIAALR